MTPLEPESHSSWMLPVIVAALVLPWLGPIAWAWRHRVRDGALPVSFGEQLRRRLER